MTEEQKACVRMRRAWLTLEKRLRIEGLSGEAIAGAREGFAEGWQARGAAEQEYLKVYARRWREKN